MTGSDSTSTAGPGDPDAGAYWQHGYRVVDDLVTPDQCAMLRRAMDHARDAGHMRADANRAYTGPHNQYAPVPAQLLLGALTPRVSALVGRALLPSYAFWRIYGAGDQLHPHRDRSACEVAITITLAAEPVAHDWPIHIIDLSGKPHSIALRPGAGLLYRGTMIEHWRAPLTGQAQYQLFLNYVLADGPNAHLVHDGGMALMP